MKNILALMLFVIIARLELAAQPELDITPSNIEFEDTFHRVENALLFNKGNQTLLIDSIRFNDRLYFLSFDEPEVFPLTILPDDTVKMEVILSNFFLVASADTADTMQFFYLNGTEVKELKIRIKFFDDDIEAGQLNGTVTNDSSSTEFTKIYIFRNGTYLYDSLTTDQTGNFSITLPEGDYTVAAQKDSFYFSFYENVFDPYFAKPVHIDDAGIKNITIPIVKRIPTGNSISGTIIDFNSGVPAKKSVLVVRKGKHDPTKMPANILDFRNNDESYATVINPDGTYTIDDILLPGYYYVQAFPDFYVPSYKGVVDEPIPFWQDADSVLIENTTIDINVFAVRDSSYGAGLIGGTVLFNSQPLPESDVIVLARNVDNNMFANYTITDSSGNFSVSNLPFGNYRLVAQSLGSESIESTETFSITALTPIVTNADLNFLVNSVFDINLNPESPILFQNYPNPFNPTTNIQFFNPKRGYVKLEVLNVLGETVQTLFEGNANQGLFTYQFNGTGLSSGVYLFRLVSENFVDTKKAVLVK